MSLLAQKCITIVPARGGSRGIPRKNIRRLAGRPLIAHTFEQARSAGLETVLLSTEDDEIASIGAQVGFEVIERPADLAHDDTPTVPVLLHALEWLRARSDERSEREFVVLLQATHPLRDPAWITECVERLLEQGADAAMTVLPVPHAYNPHWVYRNSADGHLQLFSGERQPIPRRQELPPAFHREGSVYVVRRSILESEHSLYGARTIGIEVDPSRALDLDTEEDWRHAEELIRALEDGS